MNSVRAFAVIGLVGFFGTACAGLPGRTGAPPQPGESSGAMPDLRGARVLVLPVQSSAGVAGNPDAELAFALRERGASTTWVFPDEIRRVLARSPGVAVVPERLAVGAFLRGEVQRVGDPLFGDLVRLSAVTNTPVALIPVQMRSRPGVDGSAPAVEILAAVLDTRSGRVYWTGVVDGMIAGERPGTGSADPLMLAADALARAVAR